MVNGDTSASPRAIRLGPIYKLPKWQKLPDILANYKRLRSVHPSKLDELPVFVDLGPISYTDAQSDVEIADIKEKTVRSALALGSEPEIWSQFLVSSCLSTSLMSFLVVKARVHRTVASAGVFVVSTNYISFWCKYFTQVDLKYRLPASTVRQAKPFSTYCAHGLALEIEGHPDLRFQFRTEELRAEAITRISAALKYAHEPHTPSHNSGFNTPSSPTSVSALSRSATGIFAPLERTLQAVIANGASTKLQSQLPRAINLPPQVLVKGESKHFVCLTIGSRGDVQPYIALGLGLMKEGHTVTIVTHEEYKLWIESFGIKHKQAGGDPGALMKLRFVPVTFILNSRPMRPP